MYFRGVVSPDEKTDIRCWLLNSLGYMKWELFYNTGGWTFSANEIITQIM